MSFYQDEDIIFVMGNFRARAQLLDDGRMGMKVDTARLLVGDISPEVIVAFRNALTDFLQKEGYE